MTTHLAACWGHYLAACLLCASVFPLSVANADETDSPAATQTDDDFGIVITPRVVPGRNIPATSEEAPKVPERSVALSEVTAQLDSAAQDAADEQPADGLPVIVPQPVHSPSYWEIYRSIPFLRGEYEANPSYRHEATMEILTGNPRPTKIYLNSPAAPGPIDFYPPNPYNPPLLRSFFDTTRGPYSRYQHLFGYEGGYRPMYYNY